VNAEVTVKHVLKKVFELLGVGTDSRLPDQTDLGAVEEAARQMSLNLNYRDTIVVVVELGSEFNAETGSYVRRQYLYYPFRDAADYPRIVCLKAAYRNGSRIDSNSAELDTLHDASKVQAFLAQSPEATLVWGRPGQQVKRVREERLFIQS
jgi:hypothetical protein